MTLDLLSRHEDTDKTFVLFSYIIIKQWLISYSVNTIYVFECIAPLVHPQDSVSGGIIVLQHQLISTGVGSGFRVSFHKSH